MKSFLQYITESELDFYLAPVKDHSEYMDWLSNKSDITTQLSEKIKVIQKLSSVLDVTAFKDKTTFKMFNEINWDTKQLASLQAEHQVTNLHKLVEAWSQSIINIKGT